MTRAARWLVLASILASCGGGRRAPGGGDGGNRVDGAREDSGSIDSDGGRTDGGGWVDDDGGGGVECVPAPGTATIAVGCANEVIVGIVAPSRVVVVAQLSATEASCARVDGIDFLAGERVIQHLDSGGGSVHVGRADVIAEGDAGAELATPCTTGDDSGRFDPFTVRITGTIDGGTFEAACGSGGGLPSVIRSCHSGVDAPPLGGNAAIMPMGAFDTSYLYGAYLHPHGTELRTLDATVHFIARRQAFDPAPPIAPRDSSGWMGGTSEMGDGLGGFFSHASLFSSMDLLGTDICPLSMMPGPGWIPPPIFLARISGTTTAGPFTSEIYVRQCTRPPPPP